jgi:DNA-binding NarL/FixJ family response regulator
METNRIPRQNHPNRPKHGLEALTQREVEVLTELAKGKSNKAIGVTLVVAEQTVENHLHPIYRKLGVKSRVEAVVHALIHGIGR